MDNNAINILLVEDRVDDADLSMSGLKKNEMANNLFHARDGEQALEFIFAAGKFAGKRNILQQPRLVLLEIKMPKLNGIEVLKKIREDDRTRLTPVVILTSSKEDPDIKKCYELGVHSYLVKPVNFENFSEAINILESIGYY